MVASEFFLDGLCGDLLAYSLYAPLNLMENDKEKDAVACTLIKSIKDDAV